MGSEKKKEERDLLKIVARYSLSKVYHQLVGIVTAILRPKLLHPENYGLWSLLRLFPNYSNYLHMGTQTAMRFKVPGHLGRDELEEVSRTERTVFATTMLSNGVVALLLVLVAASGLFEVKVSLGLVAMAVSVLMMAIFNFHVSYLKAHEQFGIITKINYFQKTVQALLTIGGLVLLGLYGLYIAFPLGYLVTIIFIRFKVSVPMVGQLDGKKFRELVAYGFPVLILGLAIMLVNTSDRIMVASLLGREQLGYYAISAMVMGFMMNVPGAAREIMEPRLMRELAQAGEMKLIEDYVLRPLRHTAWLMPLLVGPAIFWLDVVIPFLLPRYNQGILPTQILTLGGFFFAHVVVLRGMIVARGRQVVAAVMVLIPLALNVTGSILAVKLGYGLAGVATSSVLAYMVLYLLLLFLLSREVKLFSPGLRGRFLRLSMPFPVMMVLLFLAGLWHTIAGLDGIPAALVKTLAFAAVMLGLRHKFGKNPLAGEAT